MSSSFLAPQALQTRWSATSGTGNRSGTPRYNYGKTSWNIPRQYIEKTLIDCGGKWAENPMLILWIFIARQVRLKARMS